MNNFTPTNLPCQLLNTEIVSNTTGFFVNSLSYTFKLIFKEYFSACQNYKKVYISQEVIARRVGCKRETVNRAVRLFEELGIMTSIYRHLTTSEYSMNEFFFIPSTRKILSMIFKFYIPFALSLLVVNLGSQPEITQLNINVELFNKPNQPVRESNNYAHDTRAHVNGKFGLVGLVLQLTKKGIRVNANTYDKLKQLVEKFPMTEHGMIKLSVYPPGAIDYAMKSMNNVFSAKDPFLYFMSLCKFYCDQNKAIVDWSGYNDARKALNIPLEMPYVNEEDIAPLRIVKSEPKKKAWNKKEDHKRESLCPPDEAAALNRAGDWYATKLRANDAKRGIESDFEFVENCERGVHRKLMDDPNYYRSNGSHPYEPLRWNTLSFDEKCQILREQHPFCHCRDNLKIELGLIKAAPPKVSDAKPMKQFMDKIISSSPMNVTLDIGEPKQVAVEEPDRKIVSIPVPEISEDQKIAEVDCVDDIVAIDARTVFEQDTMGDDFIILDYTVGDLIDWE